MNLKRKKQYFNSVMEGKELVVFFTNSVC